jgi:hypothetical protein
MAKLLLFFILLASIPTQAGYFEISGSGSYRKSSLDSTNYSVFRSGTGSVAYYFWELSALELSYTESRADEINTNYKSRVYSTFYGADLIFTMATKQSLFQPYIKVGGAYIDKNGTYKLPTTNVSKLPSTSGWAPSAGIGLKFILGEHVALKAGVDAWSSPVNQNGATTYDYAGRLGLSFIF